MKKRKKRGGNKQVHLYRRTNPQFLENTGTLLQKNVGITRGLFYKKAWDPRVCFMPEDRFTIFGKGGDFSANKTRGHTQSSAQKNFIKTYQHGSSFEVLDMTNPSSKTDRDLKTRFTKYFIFCGWIRNVDFCYSRRSL